MKRRNVVYRPEAAADLDWIFDTLANAASGETARRYDQRIREFCQKLEYAAERGSRRDDVRAGLRIIGFERRVTVAFAVEPANVVILRIFYGGRNWERDFR